MNRLPRSIAWIMLPCLAIAPIGVAVLSAEHWNAAFSSPFTQQPALHTPKAVGNESEKPLTGAAIAPSTSSVVSPNLPSDPEHLAIDAPASTFTAQSFNCDNPQYQQEMNHCAYLDYQQADAALNQTYNDLLAIVSERQRGKLIDAERAWIAYRDKTCDFERSQYEGGSIEPLIFHSCMAQLTQEQTLRLETYLQEY